MSKNTSSNGIAFSLFDDAIVPKPAPKGTWGDMGGEVITGGQAPTKGEIPTVQFANMGEHKVSQPFGKESK